MSTQDKPSADTLTAPAYLSTTELSRRWHVSANTLRNWRFKGVGPRYFKPVGKTGKALYRIEDIIAWEEAHTVATEAAHD